MSMNQHLQHYYRCCFAGDLRKGADYILALSGDDATPSVVALQRKVTNRFVLRHRRKPLLTSDPHVRALIRAYHDYYQAAIYEQVPPKRAQSDLAAALLDVVLSTEHGVSDATTLDEVESDVIKPTLDSRGLYFLGGDTPPYYGPYIWRRNEPKTYCVSLPYGVTSLNVVFMHDFIEQSWMNYITFGRYRAAGWATEDAIYCDFRTYASRLQSSEFYDMFLVHEAQHVYDKQSHNLTDPVQLEYRAKLAQLIQGSNPTRFIRAVIREVANRPEYPHPYSSYLILKNTKLDATSASAAIRSLAKAALDESTEMLQQR